MSGASSGLKSASTASAAVKQSTDGQPQATTAVSLTTSAGPALSTGKGSVLAVGKEVLALAAGVAAVFAF